MKKSEADVIKEIKSRWTQLQNNRAKFEDRWTEAQQYVDKGILNWSAVDTLPEMPKRYTSKPCNYSKTLTAGIVGYGISPSITWFKLSIEQVDLLTRYGVKDFLEQCEEVMLAEFNRSNLYQEAVKMVKDGVVIGHGPMLIDEDLNNNRLRFTKFPANEIFMDINEYGEIDTCFRHYQDTLRNTAEFFGIDNLDELMQEDAKDPEKWNNPVDLLQAIFPRQEYNPEFKTSDNKPYACYYIDLKNTKIIKESGYDEFPYAVFEWDRYEGYAYSSSPAQEAMPDIKALNIIKKTSLQIAQEAAEPPMKMTDDVRDIDLSPRGKTYLPTKDSVFEPIRTGENYPITLQELSNYEQDVKDWFYVDFFLALQQRQGQMTATEVQELQGEKAATLSSMIVNLNECLKKVISRSFTLLMNAGKFPPVPRALMEEGATMKVEFVGPLAQAQKKYHTIGGTVQALSIAQPIMQLFPNAADFIDPDQLMKSAMEGQGLPQNIIREDQDVQRIRQERAIAQQQQAQMQQQMEMTQALLNNADKLNQPVQDKSMMQQLDDQMAGGFSGR